MSEDSPPYDGAKPWEPDWDDVECYPAFRHEKDGSKTRMRGFGRTLGQAIREYHRQLMAKFGPILEWARIDHEQWLDSQEEGYGICSACNGPYMACKCGAPTVLQKRRREAGGN